MPFPEKEPRPEEGTEENGLLKKFEKTFHLLGRPNAGS